MVLFVTLVLLVFIINCGTEIIIRPFNPAKRPQRRRARRNGCFRRLPYKIKTIKQNLFLLSYENTFFLVANFFRYYTKKVTFQMSIQASRGGFSQGEYRKVVSRSSWLIALFRDVCGEGYALWLVKLPSSLEAWPSRLHFTLCRSLGSKGRRSGERTRLPPMWPGFKSHRRRHMWVEFDVGSLLCFKRFFSGHFTFPLSSKPNISNFQNFS